MPRGPLDYRRLPAYTSNMKTERHKPADFPCVCGALRQASRAVSRLYDDELRGVGLRTTQYSLLQLLRRSGEVRQGDLAELTSHDETSLTRSLRPLVDARWVAVRTGDDRREKWLTITASGVAKLEEARPAWERAQARMQALLPEETRQRLMGVLQEIASPDGRRLIFFVTIDAYTGFCRGPGLAAKRNGGVMSTELEKVAKRSKVVTLLALGLGLAGCAQRALARAGGSTGAGHGELSRRARRHRLRGLHRPDGRGGFRGGAGASRVTSTGSTSRKEHWSRRTTNSSRSTHGRTVPNSSGLRGPWRKLTPACAAWSETTTAPRT